MKTRKLGIVLFSIAISFFIIPALIYGLPIPIFLLPLAVFSVIPLLLGIVCMMDVFDFPELESKSHYMNSESRNFD